MDQGQHGWSFQREKRLHGAVCVLRGGDGRWRKGTARNMGICSSIHAELWSALLGLELAWAEGHKKIVLETVAMLLNRNRANERLSNIIVSKCLELLSRELEVVVAHIYREANMVADVVSNWVLNQVIGYHLLTDPTTYVLSYLQSDMQGVIFQR